MIPVVFEESGFFDESKYRYTYTGGKEFVERFLVKYSNRESDEDFRRRRAISYCPAFAKAAINDIKNAIFQRITTVERLSGPTSYQRAIQGQNGGVDRRHTSMHTFIGLRILPELLAMRRVGVLVEREKLPENLTLADRVKSPYLHIYTTEQITALTPGPDGLPIAVELVEEIPEYDEEGFPKGTVEQHRRYWETPEGVKYKIWTQTDTDEGILDLQKLPFALFDTGVSLLHDVADYQIALLNIESSDLAYILQSNYPFYTEQTTEVSKHLKNAETDIDVGGTQGRRYGKDLDRPDFIAPPTEPLLASIKKQAVMKADIKSLVNLTLANMGTNSDSANTDDKALEAGLSFIAQVLEQGERQIAASWAEYESADQPIIKYPVKYNLKTTQESLDEAQEYRDMLPALASNTFKKEIGKKIAKALLYDHVTPEIIDTIYAEIDDSKVMIADPKVLFQALEDGIIGAELCAKTLGIPESEVAKAQIEHAERLARIQAAQTAQGFTGGARGVKDQATDPSADAKNEKTTSQTPDVNALGQAGGRGDGKNN